MTSAWRHAIAVAVTGVAAASVLAAAPAAPRGRRDLQGMWLNDTATPLERPPAFAGRPRVTEQEARDYEKRYLLDRTLAISLDKEFELDAAGDLDTYDPGHLLPGGRTSIIVDPPDGRVPALTPDARQRLADRTAHLAQHYAENPEDLRNADRCLVVGNSSVPPMLPVFYNNLVQIVQTDTALAIVSEMIHDTRIVSLTRPQHLPADVRQWKGDSIGHWDGDTLVVDTTNFTDNTSLRGSSRSVHVVERFTRTAADTLTYRFTIDDPETFVRPWTGESIMTRTAGRMFEYACHEANYSMFDVLRGARYREKNER
jgi:hypothetical protein